MIIRKVALSAAAAVVAFAGAAAGAGADSLLSEVAKPFEAAGTIYNDSPPFRPPGTEIRVYLDGDNFSLKPVTYATPRAAKRIDGSGVLGIRTTAATEYFVNGEKTDFYGAIIEGCTTEVEGVVINVPTAVNRDDLRASTVSTTCATS